MASPERRPAAFIDRDGVINAELHYVHRIEDFHILPGVFDGLRTLARAGFALVVVTNQAGIARGLYDEAAFERLTDHMQARMAAEGIALEAVYHCPHHPAGSVAAYAVECDCRKPAPGMLLRAAREHHLDLARSVMIGDKPSDTQAGRAAGVALTVLVESGHALPDDAAAQADHRSADLGQAAAWVAAQPLFRDSR
ncbi:MAG TPA: D-glycero-beta-D-manno-heptose 1,7-bisphosphate 7-phosphatase [Burkholderiaceae bacterium]